MLRLQNDLPSTTPYTPHPESQQDPLPKLILEGFLRREELAQQLGVSPRTIDRWEALRKGPPRVRCGRTILFSVVSVRSWLRSREEDTSSIKKRHSLPRKKKHNQAEPTSSLSNL
jgi:predicted DNA-binding transcriptional regulator AlpA